MATNFDRIKAMSVEEMADMLYEESETTYIYCDIASFTENMHLIVWREITQDRVVLVPLRIGF